MEKHGRKKCERFPKPGNEIKIAWFGNILSQIFHPGFYYLLIVEPGKGFVEKFGGQKLFGRSKGISPGNNVRMEGGHMGMNMVVEGAFIRVYIIQCPLNSVHVEHERRS